MPMLGHSLKLGRDRMTGAAALLDMDGLNYWMAGSLTDSQNLTQLGSGGAGDAQFGSTSGSDSNDPLYLPWTSGEGDYVYLTGTAGNYLSHPDFAAFPTGDIDIRVKCALSDWTPSGFYPGLINKWGSSGANRSFTFQVENNTGKLRFGVENSADASEFNVSSVATGIPDGQTKWVRVTYNTSTTTAVFYTSDDGSSWSQLGTDVTAFTLTDIRNSSANVNIGAELDDGSAQLAVGKFYEAIVYDNLTETGDPVLHWKASSMVQSGGADEESGQSWTINRTATGLKSTLVTRPVLVLNGAASTYLEIANHADIQMAAGDDFTIAVYGRLHAVASDMGLIINKGSYSSSANPGFALVARSIPDFRFYIADGTVSIADNYSNTWAGASGLFIGVRSVTADTIEAYRDGTGTGSPTTDTTTVTLDSGSALRVGLSPTGAVALTGEVYAALVLKGTALDADQLATLKEELDALLAGRSGE